MDKTDKLIDEFLTGKLDVKINLRKIELESASSSEEIVGTKIHDHSSPQERLIMKIDSDVKLNQLVYQRSVCSEWLKTIDKETHNIIIYRFIHKMSWLDIGLKMFMDERTARRKYNDFKLTVNDWIP